MAKVCVIDADRLFDKDLVGDSDFASLINNVKKHHDKYCFVCYNEQVKVHATTKKLADLVLHLPSIYGSVLCEFADEAYGSQVSPSSVNNAYDNFEEACNKRIHYIYNYIIANSPASFAAKSKAALAAINKSRINQI